MAIPTTLRLEFVTPERAIVHDEVDELQLPGEEGFLESCRDTPPCSSA
ncbi:MAG: hypothetical protein IPL75_13025 [Acidobacteria bacterium]|nr:hypothetical protein [Acidobacteriota bacterium]